MFDELVADGFSFAQRDWRATAAVASLLPFALTYLITTLRALIAANQKGDSRTPPIVPYAVPFLGNLWAFANDNENAIRKALSKYARDVPVRFRIANKKLIMISGSANVLAMFRASRDLSSIDTIILTIDNAFGGRMADRECYARDNTGIRKEPLPGSRPLAQSDRVWYVQHRTIHANLLGPPLVEIANRYVRYLGEELDRAFPSTEWVDVPDFYGLVQEIIFKASTTALFGPHFFALNPDICEDFWEFDNRIPTLFKLVPRLFAPKAYAARDRVHAAIKKWHKYAHENIDWNDPELPGKEWEEFFGAKLLRDRAKDFRGVDGFSEQVHAAFDVGLLWGANSNIVPTVGFCILDILARPSLTAKVRAEIASLSPGPEVNMQALLTSPLLQSIYAEELRLRNSIFIQRTPIVDNFKIGPWRLAKGDMIIASSWQESRNRETWNERGRDGERHDVEEFWAERFLTFKDDPFSGPKRVDEAKVKAGEETRKEEGETQPKFTPEAVTGQFIPYGGGENICPGRFYAKQEAMAGMALFLSKFDVELAPGTVLEPNKKQFGFGVMGPKGKIAARMRRRKDE